jgi:hypothetical protein
MEGHKETVISYSIKSTIVMVISNIIYRYVHLSIFTHSNSGINFSVLSHIYNNYLSMFSIYYERKGPINATRFDES